MHVKTAIASFLTDTVKKERIKRERNREEQIVLNPICQGARTSLTEKEKQSVENLWFPVCAGGSIHYCELEIFKHFNGFDPRYLSHHLYLPLISRRLNDYHYTKFFEDKCLSGHLTTKIPFPPSIVRCINGEFYDGAFRQISKNTAIKIIADSGEKVLFKISRNSSGGKGVKMFNFSEASDKENFVSQAMAAYGSNFVVQAAIVQSEETAIFHSSSVNTLRVSTLYLNGRVSLCGIMLRIGMAGSLVDNAGSGGTGVDVDENGYLKAFGFNIQCQKMNTANGVPFEGRRLVFIPDLIEKILRLHVEELPLCKFVGWDVCVNSRGEYVVIEINSSQPGIFIEQLTSGHPIFGDRTEEVIKYVKDKKVEYAGW